MNKATTVLMFSQGIYHLATALLISTSALIGISLAPEAGLATFPLGVQYLIMTLSTYPASMLMVRYGRKRGFQLGTLAGIAAVSGIIASVILSNFWIFVFASGLMGIHSAIAQYYRYAATEFANPGRESEAMSYVFAAGLLSAFVGPRLAVTHGVISDKWPFADGYILLLPVMIAALLAVAFLPAKTLAAARKINEERPVPPISLRTRVLAASAGAVAYAAMNSLMATTPLAMQICGYSLGSTTTVIQWHIVAMFAPSLVMGRVIKNFGAKAIIQTGALLIVLCIAINLTGDSVTHFFWALLMLGVGWNFMYTGATSLISIKSLTASSGKTQGQNDMVVFGTVALTAMSSGYLQISVGWFYLNLIILPLVLVVLIQCLVHSSD
jgi:MFS family permease